MYFILKAGFDFQIWSFDSSIGRRNLPFLRNPAPDTCSTSVADRNETVETDETGETLFFTPLESMGYPVEKQG